MTAFYPTASINTTTLIDFANATLSNIELIALGDGAARVFNSNLTATATRVIDAGSFSNWGTLFYSANETNASRVVLYTRSGNSSVPDAFWSGFHNYSQSGLSIASPSSRYLEWTRFFGRQTPRLSKLNYVNATFNTTS